MTFGSTTGYIILAVVALCAAVSALCVVFDDKGEKVGVFVLKHRLTSNICLVCFWVAFILSVFWVIFCPLGIENELLSLLLRILLFVLFWLGIIVVFFLIGGIATFFIKK